MRLVAVVKNNTGLAGFRQYFSPPQAGGGAPTNGEEEEKIFRDPERGFFAALGGRRARVRDILAPSVLRAFGRAWREGVSMENDGGEGLLHGGIFVLGTNQQHEQPKSSLSREPRVFLKYCESMGERIDPDRVVEACRRAATATAAVQ